MVGTDGDGLSLLIQSPAAHYAYQAVEGVQRRAQCLLHCAAAGHPRRAHGRGSVPAASESQSRPGETASFLKEASPESTATLRIAFEFRHVSWFASEIFELLRQHQAALCVAESDELQTPDIVTAPFCCYRLRKSDYGPAELEQIEKQLADKASQGDVFAYIKHEDTPKGALQAASLLARLKAQ